MFRFLILALTVSTIPVFADIFNIAASGRRWVSSNGTWLRWLRCEQGGHDPIPEEASWSDKTRNAGNVSGQSWEGPTPGEKRDDESRSRPC